MSTLERPSIFINLSLHLVDVSKSITTADAKRCSRFSDSNIVASDGSCMTHTVGSSEPLFRFIFWIFIVCVAFIIAKCVALIELDIIRSKQVNLLTMPLICFLSIYLSIVSSRSESIETTEIFSNATLSSLTNHFYSSFDLTFNSIFILFYFWHLKCCKVTKLGYFAYSDYQCLI